jgi:hypothetical protein
MREIIFKYPLNDTIQCPVGIDANDPHTFEQGTGRLAFYDIMGLSGHYREICQECSHPMNEPVVDGGLELAPDLPIYSVRVDGNETDYYLTPRQAMDTAYQWEIHGCEDVAIYLTSGHRNLELPSGYAEMIMNWATSQANALTAVEYGGDWWHTWTSPGALHSYDINIYSSYDSDDKAKVVVYGLTTDENHDVVTNNSVYCFIGTVDISHMN